MFNKKINRAVAFVLATTMLLQPCGMSSVNTAFAEDKLQETKEIEYTTERLLTGYSAVSAEYTAKEYTGETITFRMDEIIKAEYSDKLTEENKDYGNPVVQVTAGDKIELEVEVPETALYQIEFDYLSNDESILPIEMSFQVDGAYPFYETRNLKFETTWITDGETSF